METSGKSEYDVVDRAAVEAVIDALDKHRTHKIDGAPAVGEEAVWTCKIGGSFPHGALPGGSDLPMRRAIQAAYEQVTGQSDGYVFSGWGGRLDESERATVENRWPVYERTEWALYKGAADLIEALWSEVEALRAAR